LGKAQWLFFLPPFKSMFLVFFVGTNTPPLVPSNAFPPPHLGFSGLLIFTKTPFVGGSRSGASGLAFFTCLVHKTTTKTMGEKRVFFGGGGGGGGFALFYTKPRPPVTLFFPETLFGVYFFTPSFFARGAARQKNLPPPIGKILFGGRAPQNKIFSNKKQFF